MDPRAVVGKAEEALGVERARSAAILASASKRKRRPSDSSVPRKRAATEAASDRAETRKAWRAFVFSIAYNALHPKKAERAMGPKEKAAVAIMRKQRGWIGSAVRARWADLGPPGLEFGRSIVSRYERSVVEVIVEAVVSETAPPVFKLNVVAVTPATPLTVLISTAVASVKVTV